MPVAKVSEISATSSKSFEDAIQSGLARAAKTLRHIRSAWVKEQQVRCDEGRIIEYLKDHPQSTAGDIAKALNANRDTIAAGLSHIARASDVTKG